MYLYFSKVRLLVNLWSVPTYIIWTLSRLFDSRIKLKEAIKFFWVTAFWFRLPKNDVEQAIKTAHLLGIQIDWIRYPTDGTRIQIFDRKNSLICKFILDSRLTFLVKRELKTRKLVQEMTPKVITVGDEGNAFCEEWIDGCNKAYSKNMLLNIITKLHDKLYNIKYMPINTYIIRYLDNVKYNQYIFAAIERLGWETLPISPVHGDLTSPNILWTISDQPILLDWEYTRTCLITYDCWLFIYQNYKSQINQIVIFPQFLLEFQEILLESKLIEENLTLKQVICIHILHLVERCVYLELVTPCKSLAIRENMLNEMRTALTFLETK